MPVTYPAVIMFEIVSVAAWEAATVLSYPRVTVLNVLVPLLIAPTSIISLSHFTINGALAGNAVASVTVNETAASLMGRSKVV
jgi:hypothetical protein